LSDPSPSESKHSASQTHSSSFMNAAHTHTVHSTMNENKPQSRMEWQRRHSVFRNNTNCSDDVSGRLSQSEHKF